MYLWRFVVSTYVHMEMFCYWQFYSTVEAKREGRKQLIVRRRHGFCAAKFPSSTVVSECCCQCGRSWKSPLNRRLLLLLHLRTSGYCTVPVTTLTAVNAGFCAPSLPLSSHSQLSRGFLFHQVKRWSRKGALVRGLSALLRPLLSCVRALSPSMCVCTVRAAVAKGLYLAEVEEEEAGAAT